MRPVIYTDGDAMDVSDEERAFLLNTGLCVQHPGAGEDGIRDVDLKLANDVEWDQVREAIGGQS